MGNLLSRAMEKLAHSTDPEDSELRQGARKAGCDLIATKQDRDVVTLYGTLRTVTLQPRSGVSALEAELYDGSGRLLLVWLGRRRIAGIEPGRRLTVHGRLGERDGETVLFNPRYELSA
ncbi:MAG: OB-fold nucleic acid binding domain-containing protein [Nocardioidaceae bacterium]